MMGAVTLSRWINRTPNACLRRAVDGLPEWSRWPLAWVALLCAMMIACSVLAIAGSLALGVV